MFHRIYRSVLALLVAASLFSCGGGGGGEPASDENACAQLHLKVMGGEECRTDISPVVAVVPVDINGNQIAGLWICTGTLVTLDDVLTAAHCVTEPAKRGADAIVVVAGGQVYPVVGIAVHPSWDGERHDVALLRISAPANIAPVPLGITDPIVAGDRVTAFGYGTSEDPNSGLRAANMTIAAVIPEAFTTSYDETGSGICQGDSGGPVIRTANGVASIVGVTSVTLGGCSQGSYSGFMNMQDPANYNFVLSYVPDAGTT